MIDYTATRAITLAAGRSGTGKTTFCLRYLVNASDLAGRFLWDADGQMASRLGLASATTAEDLEASLDDGWTIFDPNALFPGRHGEGFAWFAAWAYAAAARLRGPSVLLVDEVWRYCTPHAIPQPLAECIQTGRVRGLSCMFATQRPNKLNGAIVNEVTECVAFRLQDPLALRVVASCGCPEAEVAALAPGEWLSVGCETGARMRGRLWGGVSGSRTLRVSENVRPSRTSGADAGGGSPGAAGGRGSRLDAATSKCSPSSSPSSVPSSSPSSS